MKVIILGVSSVKIVILEMMESGVSQYCKYTTLIPERNTAATIHREKHNEEYKALAYHFSLGCSHSKYRDYWLMEGSSNNTLLRDNTCLVTYLLRL